VQALLLAVRLLWLLLLLRLLLRVAVCVVTEASEGSVKEGSITENVTEKSSAHTNWLCCYNCSLLAAAAPH
jgi:hypothetical protein